MAPGKAPTKTDNGVLVFSGVYKLTYINIEIAPNIAVLGLIMYSTVKPTKVSKEANTKFSYSGCLCCYWVPIH